MSRKSETQRPGPGLQAYASLEDHRLLPRGARWVEGERWRAGAAAVAALVAGVLTESYLWGVCSCQAIFRRPLAPHAQLTIAPLN
eukprot:COSAG01_NODE_7067_length_3368_cov_12.018748_4_plen_85_part_00